MTRFPAAALLALFALAGGAGSRTYVHRVAIVFEPGSPQVPLNAAAVLRSMFDDARRGCAAENSIAVSVEEVAPLPLGKTSGGATARTRQVSALVRDVFTATQPYEGSFPPQGDRARRQGLRADEVVVELTCPAREG